MKTKLDDKVATYWFKPAYAPPQRAINALDY